MSVMENFGNGLIVTGLGMGLVFLTLIIVMYCIKLLDWAFKPKAAAALAGSGATWAAVPTSAQGLAGGTDPADEAAAIAVAIALAQAEARAAPPSPATTAASSLSLQTTDARELPPEVVTVTSIDPGPGTWKAYGRIKAMQGRRAL